MINYHIPLLNKQDELSLAKCIKSNFVSTAGKLTDKFEKEFCNKFKFKYSIALNSGTSSLHVALIASGIEKNDIVILPSYTFAATCNAVLYCGAEPWLVDTDEDLLLNLDKLKILIKKKTYTSNKKLYCKNTNKTVKAIIPVASFGSKLDCKKYENFAKKNFLKVIFDTASNHNPKNFYFRKNKESIFCFSFNGNKPITTGSGGMLSTNSKKIYNKARLISNVGKTKKKYDYKLIGYNYKMSNLQSALGISQLKKINYIFKLKKKIYNFYNLNIKNNFFSETKNINLNWLYYIYSKKINKLNLIKSSFKKNKIENSQFWKPLHLLKPYKKFKKGDMLICGKIWNKILILPSHAMLKKKSLYKIIKIINKIAI